MIIGLESLDIQHTVDPYLVRGLDYYSHTVFEIIEDKNMGGNALIAGGRYNSLFEELGGTRVDCFGWAAGVDRLVGYNSKENDRVSTIAVSIYSL